ncbi:hypothetical protein [Curtobacterium sp. VKM Ac-1393]|nr:hypothetical protein [Curtobacterium sp. VKM Ac-1393]
MPQPPSDDQIQHWLDTADDNPDEYTPEQIANLARGRDKNAK